MVRVWIVGVACWCSIVPGHCVVRGDCELVAFVAGPRPVEIGYRVRQSTSPGLVELNIDVRLPRDAARPIRGTFQLVGPDMTPVKSGDWSMREGFSSGSERRTSFSLRVPPGPYVFRLTTADGAGAANSIAADILAKLGKFGQLEVSGLYTADVSAVGGRTLLAAETLPSEIQMLEVFLELYGARTLPVPGVSFQMMGSASGHVEGPIVGEVAKVSSGWRATGRFRVGDLARDLYRMRAAVSVNGRSIGVLETVLRKE